MRPPLEREPYRGLTGALTVPLTVALAVALARAPLPRPFPRPSPRPPSDKAGGPRVRPGIAAGFLALGGPRAPPEAAQSQNPLCDQWVFFGLQGVPGGPRDGPRLGPGAPGGPLAARRRPRGR